MANRLDCAMRGEREREREKVWAKEIEREEQNRVTKERAELN